MIDMIYDVEFKVKGQIDVKDKGDLKSKAWDEIWRQFGECVFANDGSELKFLKVTGQKSGKAVDMKKYRRRPRKLICTGKDIICEL